MTSDISSTRSPGYSLDALMRLAETHQLGKRIQGLQICPDGEGQWLEFELGLVLFHPDLGAHAVPGRFASVWKAEQSTETPLGYPVRPHSRVPGKKALGWQEFENGVFYGSLKGEVQTIRPLPMGKGSYSLEALTEMAREYLRDIVATRSDCEITKLPECISLLDFQLHDSALAPRGHVFQFTAAYHQVLLPTIVITVTCDIRWSVESGKNQMLAWLHEYAYTIDVAKGMNWAMPKHAIETAVSEMVAPWLRQPQAIALAPQPLLCVKVLPDGGLYGFALPAK